MNQPTVERDEVSNAKLVEVACPPDIFDVEGAAIWRRKRVPMWRLDAIKTAPNQAALFENLTALVPKWKGVLDVETGEALAHPQDDPNVFDKLDTEQLGWIVEMLQVMPGKLAGYIAKGRT